MDSKNNTLCCTSLVLFPPTLLTRHEVDNYGIPLCSRDAPSYTALCSTRKHGRPHLLVPWSPSPLSSNGVTRHSSTPSSTPYRPSQPVTASSAPSVEDEVSWTTLDLVRIASFSWTRLTISTTAHDLHVSLPHLPYRLYCSCRPQRCRFLAPSARDSTTGVILARNHSAVGGANLGVLSWRPHDLAISSRVVHRA